MPPASAVCLCLLRQWIFNFCYPCRNTTVSYRLDCYYDTKFQEQSQGELNYMPPNIEDFRYRMLKFLTVFYLVPLSWKSTHHRPCSFDSSLEMLFPSGPIRQQRFFRSVYEFSFHHNYTPKTTAVNGKTREKGFVHSCAPFDLVNPFSGNELYGFFWALLCFPIHASPRQ